MYWRFVVLCICFAVCADCWYMYHSLSLGSLHWTCTHVCILYCLFIYALIFFLIFFYLNVFLHFIYMPYIYSYFPAHILLEWTAYHSGASELTPLFLWGSCYAVFSFLCSVCRSLCVIFVIFPLVIVLSVHLRFIPSDYFLVSSNFSLYWLLSCKNPRFNLRDQTGILLQHIVSLLQAKLFLILWSFYLLRRTLL